MNLGVQIYNINKKLGLTIAQWSAKLATSLIILAIKTIQQYILQLLVIV